MLNASTLNLVVFTGQSLSCGSYSSPPVSINNYGNGVRLKGSVFSTQPKLEQMIEGSPQVGWPPQETPIGGALEYATNAQLDCEDLMLGIHSGVPSAGYFSLKKGSDNWNNVFIPQLLAIKQLKRKVNPVAICLIHGEADSLAGNYKNNLIQWQKDFSEAISQILELPLRSIPFLMCQPSNFMAFKAIIPTYPGYPVSGLDMLELAREQPDKFKLVCPKYPLIHSADKVHLTNYSSQKLGHYHGRVIKSIVNRSNWTGFIPKGITKISSLVYQISFDVPVAPLQFETSAIASLANKGFTSSDGAISSVIISSPTTVDVIFAGEPALGTDIRYAWSSPALDSGPVNGPRGQLMDSDLSAPYDKPAGSMPNWCPHFSIKIP